MIHGSPNAAPRQNMIDGTPSRNCTWSCPRHHPSIALPSRCSWCTSMPSSLKLLPCIHPRKLHLRVSIFDLFYDPCVFRNLDWARLPIECIAIERMISLIPCLFFGTFPNLPFYLWFSLTGITFGSPACEVASGASTRAIFPLGQFQARRFWSCLWSLTFNHLRLPPSRRPRLHPLHGREDRHPEEADAHRQVLCPFEGSHFPAEGVLAYDALDFKERYLIQRYATASKCRPEIQIRSLFTNAISLHGLAPPRRRVTARGRISAVAMRVRAGCHVPSGRGRLRRPRG